MRLQSRVRPFRHDQQQTRTEQQVAPASTEPVSELNIPAERSIYEKILKKI